MSDSISKAQNRLSAVASSISGALFGPDAVKFPAFDDLPKVEGQPQGCLWGFFDKDGKKDQIGSKSKPMPVPTYIV
jgi:hypothetical protein